MLAPWSSSREKTVVLCLLLVMATLVFYNPIVRNQFVDFDDLSYIVKNPQIQHGLTWDTVKWSFTTFREGNWHPLTWLSHALDYQLFHLNPAGHHYTNLLLHTANAVLLFLLLLRATGSAWPSFLVAALFALHPVNVESVAWAAERKNVLSMLFFLLALHAYVRANDRCARSGQRRLYVLVVLLFALGLMAKPQIVTLPFVLLLWDYWPLERFGARFGARAPAAHTAPDAPASTLTPTPVPRSFSFLVWEKLPLFILAGADSVVTVFAQRAGDAVRSVTEVSWSARLENVFVAYARYLGKAFWPTRLAPLYPRPWNSLPAWQVAGSAALLVMLSVLVLLLRRRRYLLVGWFWFLGTLVPMIGIITVGEQAMADRYAYLPFIGLFIAVVWTVNDWTTSARPVNAVTRDPAAHRISIAGRAAPAIALLFILGCLTYRQLAHWRDDETLWRYTLSVTERNYMAHNNLALALAKQERSDEAIAEFRAATLLHKYPPGQIVALASYELSVGHLQEAIEACDSVLGLSNDPANDPTNDPNHAPDSKTQAAAWIELGQAHSELGHYDQAAEDYQNALRVSPENSLALIGSGLLALRQQQPDAAVVQFAHVVKVAPTAVNYLLLSQALRRAGRPAESDVALEQAHKISPDLAQAQMVATQFLSFAGLKPM
jgi:tetratricopeptide (TPR) repeat protein